MRAAPRRFLEHFGLELLGIQASQSSQVLSRRDAPPVELLPGSNLAAFFEDVWNLEPLGPSSLQKSS